MPSLLRRFCFFQKMGVKNTLTTLHLLICGGRLIIMNQEQFKQPETPQSEGGAINEAWKEARDVASELPEEHERRFCRFTQRKYAILDRLGSLEITGEIDEKARMELMELIKGLDTGEKINDARKIEIFRLIEKEETRQVESEIAKAENFETLFKVLSDHPFALENVEGRNMYPELIKEQIQLIEEMRRNGYVGALRYLIKSKIFSDKVSELMLKEQEEFLKSRGK